MIGHHVMHGGYSKTKGRYHRFSFAKGFKRRLNDWLDWMLPEAWNVEHNKLHHYQLGEPGDPDLVERNMKDIRDAREAGVPTMLLYPIVAFFVLTWKWFYYAPNTLKEYEKSVNEAKDKKDKKNNWGHLGELPATLDQVFLAVIFKGKIGMLWDVIACLGPYAIFMFGVIPGVTFVLLGKERA